MAGSNQRRTVVAGGGQQGPRGPASVTRAGGPWIKLPIIEVTVHQVNCSNMNGYHKNRFLKWGLQQNPMKSAYLVPQGYPNF